MHVLSPEWILKNKVHASQSVEGRELRRVRPTFFVRYPSQGKHGLYIEFKTPGREATPEQIDFMKEAEIDGYATALVCSRGKRRWTYSAPMWA